MILRPLLPVGFALLAGLLASCSEVPKRDPAKAGPFFTPTNVTSLGRLPAELRRVVVLPTSSGPDVMQETAARVDQAIAAELNRTGRFEVTSVSREELRALFGASAFDSTSALPPDFFEKLAKRYGADGVLLTDLTQFSAYPPVSVGLRIKLARLADQQIVWAADNVFSAADPAVANSARRHSLELGSDRGPGDLSHTILQNPSRFIAYAAAETFKTLPER